MLKDKNVLIGVTGGIACYKTVELASRLKKAGARVKVILTESAMEFVTPLTFRSIINDSVVTKLFDPKAPIEHISLADWSDLIVIAPATANIIGKIANGIADDLLSTTVMAATCPLVIAPAMNVHMYENMILQGNIEKLLQNSYHIIPPATGRLACGYEGKGRLPEAEEILWFLKSYAQRGQDLKGVKVLVTAGACRENLDPMRYISNQSSGKMGLAIARAAFHRGADVTFIHGKLHESVPYYLNSTLALSADEMYAHTKQQFLKSELVLMTAAVTDFKPVHYSDLKLKKESCFNTSSQQMISIEFEKTVDTLHELGRIKTEQIIVGFAAETDNIVANARKKLESKRCDFIAANNINTSGQDATEITLISKTSETVLSGEKFFAAHMLLDEVAKSRR